MSERGDDRRPVPDPTTLTQALVDRAVAEVKELFMAQVARIEQRLNHNERQRLEQKEDSVKALDTALISVKEAGDKLEGSFTRILAQQAETQKADVQGLRREIEALRERISDNKERTAAIEQQKVGITEQRVGTAQVIAYAFGIGGLVVAIASVILRATGH